MPIINRDIQQGSDAWIQARCGLPTASRFDSIITPKGAPSKSAERYLYTLLSERCLGHPVTEHMTMWMARGSELEQDAIRYYHLQTDLDTEPVGLVINDTRTIAASPDRLVGESGLLEVKVPAEWQHLSFLLNSGSVFEYCKIQALGQLWVCEREFVDIMSYCPALPPAIVRIERDEAFIKLLSAAVTAFSDTLEQLSADLQQRGWIREWPLAAKPKPVDSMRGTLDALRNAMVGQ